MSGLVAPAFNYSRMTGSSMIRYIRIAPDGYTVTQCGGQEPICTILLPREYRGIYDCQTFEFIIISEKVPFDAEVDELGQKKVVEEPFPQSGRYNCMMIKRLEDGTVERAGISKIFKAEWKKVVETWEDFVLG